MTLVFTLFCAEMLGCWILFVSVNGGVSCVWFNRMFFKWFSGDGVYKNTRTAGGTMVYVWLC